MRCVCCGRDGHAFLYSRHCGHCLACRLAEALAEAERLQQQRDISWREAAQLRAERDEAREGRDLAERWWDSALTERDEARKRVEFLQQEIERLQAQRDNLEEIGNRYFGIIAGDSKSETEPPRSGAAGD